MSNRPEHFLLLILKNGIGGVLSNLGLKELRLSETEKYAHVTFFLNGGRDAPSPKVKTCDMQSEINAPEVTEHLVNAITGGQKPLLKGGNLAGLEPTMLAILGVRQPVKMTGRPLI